LSDTVEKTRNGAILYDTAIINQISERAFVANGWPVVQPIQGTLRSAGRGKTLVVSDGEHEFVLRHYIRGGLPGRLIRDSYIWLGERQTRSFAEWYLLAKLQSLGLPVPRSGTTSAPNCIASTRRASITRILMPTTCK
jgi:3-deoxy-D-manno-octulosonic acid kinase